MPSHPAELALAGVVVVTAVVLFATMPPFTEMPLAVIAAVFWCLWLDRHPTA